jgi:phage portal protein BeeE
VTSLLDRLRGRPSSPPRAAKAVTDISPWQGKVPLSLYSQEPQEKARAYLGAYKVGWFYKAGSKIARDVSTLDWSVSDGDAEEGEEETTLDRPDLRIPFRSLGPIDQFMRLLERPNPSYTGRQLFHKTQVRIDFAGAAAWYLENGSQGLPTAIYGISPARMWPSYDKAGKLIGWVMDKDKPEGGVPFAKEEILWFTTGNATDDEIWGQSVVEAVYAQVPLSEQAARHTSNVLTTGGRLAGMLWPKDRALSENEFIDAQRAWRNVASDPNAAKRLLIFPEPMEYASGASTPAEIGIPELAELNQTEILTAFPVSPYMLGVPQPAGMNASGETRREERRDYWEGTIHPRADLLEEFIQVGLLDRYEEAEGRTLDFEIAEPDLDDAPALMEKAAAFKGLISIGLDPEESLGAVGLAHIKWLGLPDLLDPAKQAAMAAQAAEAQGDGSRTVVRDDTPKDNTATQQTVVGKHQKARDDVAKTGLREMSAFLDGQRDRVVERLRDVLPASKTARTSFTKTDPDWWDAAAEDAFLREALQTVYLQSARGSLQVVADTLDRIVPNKAVDRVVADLLAYGGERIVDINARTLQAITIELAEGTRRGYSIAQLIDGVPSEGFRGVKDVGLDNGIGVWGDARAETIARTETALSYNRAALDAYREFRVSRVTAIDGDHDAECAARNGAEFSLDDAFSIADHPNGTLDWAPVVP